MPRIVPVGEFRAENIDPPDQPDHQLVDDEDDDSETLEAWRNSVVAGWKQEWVDLTTSINSDPVARRTMRLFQRVDPDNRKKLREWLQNASDKSKEQTREDNGLITVDDMLNFDRDNDETSVMGNNRWLCKGSQSGIQGPTGVGKSSLIMQWSTSLNLGKGLLGIEGLKPSKPMRVLIIQAENDLGDMSEAFQDILDALRISEEELNLIKHNLTVIRNCSVTGQDFVDFLKRSVEDYEPDVVFVDPLLAYVGGDALKQDVVTKFLRNMVQPVVQETGIVLIWVHHISKQGGNNGRSKTNDQKKYSGLGSVEMQNVWREVIDLSEGVGGWFQLNFLKRGTRLGMKGAKGNLVKFVNIKHSPDGIVWIRPTGAVVHLDEKSVAVAEEEEKVRKHIISQKTVSRNQLTIWASKNDIGMNKAISFADGLSEKKDLNPRIYKYKRGKENVYSTMPQEQ